MGTFDPQAADKIKNIGRLLQSRGFVPDAYEPHVTFGIYTGLQEADLLGWVAPLAEKSEPVGLYFDHFGSFPGTSLCFLAPSASAALIALHARIHQKFDHCCTDKGCLYSLGEKSWTPHTTLASFEPEQIGALYSVLSERFSPFPASVTRLVVTATEPDEVLGTFALRA